MVVILETSCFSLNTQEASWSYKNVEMVLEVP